MKNRSFFVAGALLLASMFTTSCDEIMSNLDQPVSSYLTVNAADVTIPLDEGTYQIEASSINSDKPITYKSSNPEVATVDAKGIVTPLIEGETEITVAVEASENYNAGEQKVKIAVKQPLTFEAKKDGQIEVQFGGFVTEKPVVYTINKGAKKELTTNAFIDVKKGDKVQFESANETLTAGDGSWGVQIQPKQSCAVYGNVMSMISPDGNYHTQKTITKDYALFGLLCGDGDWDGGVCKELYTISHDKYKLTLPATTLTKGCYSWMLAYTGLTEVPELPATEIPDYAYQFMFNNCYELTEAPAITVENVGEYGMALMFYGCSKLTKANAISVKTAGEGAFQGMFNSCVEMTESPEINAKNIDYLACDGMFFNCQKLTKANAIAVEGTIGEQALKDMFEQCVELTESPAITAESIGEYACQNMFSGCQKLKKANAIKVKTAGNYAFQNLFANQPELTDAVAVNAETMGEWACSYMFNNCPKLKNVPATLPATTLAERCYSDMFAGCTSLKKAPALPATDLKSYCYNYMFGGCSALTEAPELKAATLAYGCYCAMFLNCSKLNKVTCLATTNAPDALGIWLAGAGTDTSVTTRTLVRAEANTNWTNNDGWDWPSTNWYVPTGWTIDPAIPAE